MDSKLILVTGDPVCDNNYYKGKRNAPDASEPLGFRSKQMGGGALLLHDLIERTMKPEGWQTETNLDQNLDRLPKELHAFCLWEPQATDKKNDNEVWRANEPPLGYGHPESECAKAQKLTAVASKSKQKPEIIVIDDSGEGFRHKGCSHLWPRWSPADRPRWVVIKQSGGIGNNAFWDELQKMLPSGKEEPNLVVVVGCGVIRGEDVRLSRGLSWEETVEDLVAELDHNQELAPLKLARHVIVTFRSDGAFWLDNRPGGARRALVFDAEHAEAEWESSRGKGGVFGYQSCFAAAIVRELCLATDREPDLEAALVSGLSASRELWRRGHGPVYTLPPTKPWAQFELWRGGHGPVYTTNKPKDADAKKVDTTDVDVTGPAEAKQAEPEAAKGKLDCAKQANAKDDQKKTINETIGFPFDEVVARINDPTDRFACVHLPQFMKERGTWMMLDEWQAIARQSGRFRPHNDVAFAVALMGPRALMQFPIARFGGLQTVDRQEIESLRTIRRLIDDYERGGPKNKPLSIGVFGPPGAGKSFGVKEIAKAILGPKLPKGVKVPILTFNLSQFNGPEDIIGALHQVRDAALRGITPVIFWDEFDSQNYKWLQYLLAPMQDGEFQEGPITHPVGKSIFVFAGATSETYDEFGPPNPDLTALPPGMDVDKARADWWHFVLIKGPDFKSRLAGYLNVLGPNPRQLQSTSGLPWVADPSDTCYALRRAFFIRSQFGLKDEDWTTEEVLNIDHGLLVALLEVSRFKAGSRSLEILCQILSADPTGVARRSQVPGRHLLNMHVDANEFWTVCERDIPFVAMAEQLARYLHEGYRRQVAAKSKKSKLDVPFDALPEDKKDANVAQALRIPRILRLVDMALVRGATIKFEDLSQMRDPSEDSLRDKLREHVEYLAEAEHNGWMVERLTQGYTYARNPDPDSGKKQQKYLIPYGELMDDIKSYDRDTIVGKAPVGDEHERFGYLDIVKLVGFKVVAVNQGNRP